MTVYKIQILQDDSLQEVMIQFTRHKHGNLLNDRLQDMGMNAIGKTMVHCLNLDGMWTYDHKDENA